MFFVTHNALTHFLLLMRFVFFKTPERRPGREAILRTPGKLGEVLEVQPIDNGIRNIFLFYNMTQYGHWLSKLTWFGW